MKIMLISVLLLFELCSGFSIQKVQYKRSPATTERPTEMYEVEEEDSNTVRLVFPKPEKPTLREIVYYHVIETPYDETDEVKPEPKASEDSLKDEDYYEDDYVFPEGVGAMKVRNEDGGTKTVKLDVRGDGRAVSQDVQQEGQSDDQDEVQDVFPAFPGQEDDQHKTLVSDEEIKNTRSLLFDQAKSKYQTKMQSKPFPRAKREVSYKRLPPAPTLPPLELGKFPEYIRSVISATKSFKESANPSKDKLSHFNEEDFEDELENKIENTISAFQEKNQQSDEAEDYEDSNESADDDNYSDDEDNSSGTKDDDEENDNGEDHSSEHNSELELINKLPPRTFGMNLTMGRGYVWNDLVSDPGTPGISFGVDKPNKASDNTRDEITKHKDSMNIPEKESEKPDTKPSTTENLSFSELFTNLLPIIPNNTAEMGSKENPQSHNEINYNLDTNNKDEDLDDIAVYTFNKKPKLLIDEESYPKKEAKHKKNHHHDYDRKNNDSKITDHHDCDDIKNEENYETIEPNKLIDSDITKNNNKDGDKKVIDDKKAHLPHHRKDKDKHNSKTFDNSDALKELLKDEQFWKWLSDWTSLYMELLMKHIKELVHDEVSRQIKSLNLGKESQPEVNLFEHKFNNEKDYDTQDLVDDRDGLWKKSYFNKEIHNGNIIIDGKEIPVTHNSNFDLSNEKNDIIPLNYNSQEESDDLADFLRHKVIKNKKRKEDEHMDKKHKHNKKGNSTKDGVKSPTTISATNIFGSAVDSGKVTNIFIFYPNDDKEYKEIVTSAQSLANANDKIQLDERLPDLSGLKDESTMTEEDSHNENNNDKQQENKLSEKDKNYETDKPQDEDNNGNNKKQKLETDKPKNGDNNDNNKEQNPDTDKTNDDDNNESNKDQKMKTDKQKDDDNNESKKERNPETDKPKDDDNNDSNKEQNLETDKPKDDDDNKSNNKQNPETDKPKDDNNNQSNKEQNPEAEKPKDDDNNESKKEQNPETDKPKDDDNNENKKEQISETGKPKEDVKNESNKEQNSETDKPKDDDNNENNEKLTTESPTNSTTLTSSSTDKKQENDKHTDLENQEVENTKVKDQHENNTSTDSEINVTTEVSKKSEENKKAELAKNLPELKEELKAEIEKEITKAIEKAIENALRKETEQESENEAITTEENKTDKNVD